MIFALRLRIWCTYTQYHLTTLRYYIVCKARGNNILFQTWRNMMTLNPNLRKIICLVAVDFVCLLLVGVPCLLLWLVGKWLVLQGNRILKYLIRRSIFPWILLWRWNSAPPLQRLHCSNMGAHCCQLRTANYCVQVGGLQNWKERKLCSFSLVETSRLKRSATFNWTRFLRWSSHPEQVGLRVFSPKISMESKTNQIEIFVCRDIYGVLGIFVFGSLVTQLLTDTSKYTIGEYTYHLRNMKIIFLLSIRSTQTTFPDCLST